MSTTAATSPKPTPTIRAARRGASPGSPRRTAASPSSCRTRNGCTATCSFRGRLTGARRIRPGCAYSATRENGCNERSPDQRIGTVLRWSLSMITNSRNTSGSVLLALRCEWDGAGFYLKRVPRLQRQRWLAVFLPDTAALEHIERDVG